MHDPVWQLIPHPNTDWEEGILVRSYTAERLYVSGGVSSSRCIS